jgi:hypothetical protein
MHIHSVHNHGVAERKVEQICVEIVKDKLLSGSWFNNIWNYWCWIEWELFEQWSMTVGHAMLWCLLKLIGTFSLLDERSF